MRSGSASLTVDDAAVVARLDQVTEGAASSFLRIATESLTRVWRGTQRTWPVRSGLSKGAFNIRQRVLPSAVSPSRLSAALYNDAKKNGFPYAYALKWSVRTTDSLADETRNVSMRGNSGLARQKIARFWAGRLRYRHGLGAPEPKVAGKRPWIYLVRKPGKAEASAMIPALQLDLNRLAAKG